MTRLGSKLTDLSTIFVALAAGVISAELVLRLLGVPEYLIPLPTTVLGVLQTKTGYLGFHTVVTAVESIAGFVVGNLCAYGAAILFAYSRRIERIGMPVAIAVKATPVVALAPLFIIWFGNGMVGKGLMAALVCFFPMLVNSVSGLRSADSSLIDYMYSLSATRSQILRMIRIPSSLPFVFAAAKTSSTISVVGAVVAELAGSDAGIGHILLVSIYQVETDLMFAAIICIAAFGGLFYAAVASTERAMLEPYSSNQSTR